jgi:iron complex outermembrane receptor protein
MSMTRKAISALIVSLFFAGSLLAQDTGGITGRVIDAMTLEPITNANVVVEDLLLGDVTGPEGTFLVTQVPVGTYRVRASLIGYAPMTQEVTVTAGDAVTVNFSLQIQAVVMEEIVTTGYGVQRRLAITGSVATVDAAEADVGVVSNVNEMLDGRVAGLLVTANTGEPGSGQQIRIRGGTSLSASNEPLYVIDGVAISNQSTEPGGIGIGGDPSLPRSPLNLLNPSDIAKITVLKDAAAAAIYGSRGANGVILIETKQGAAGTVNFEYDGYAAISSPASRLDVLNGAEYRSFIQEQVAAGNLAQSRLDGLGTANTDWEDAVTRTAVTQNHNLSFTGGTQATRFRASLNYMDQRGVVRNNGFQRIQGRLNGTHTAINDRLRLDLRLTSSRVENNYLPSQNTGGFEGAVFNNMVAYNPTRPVTVVDPETGEVRFFELGTGVQSSRNPVAIAEQLEDEASTTRTLGSLTTQFDVLSNLTAQVTLGVDASSAVRRTYFPASNPVGAEWNGRAVQQSRDRTDLTFQGLLTFNESFGLDHSVEVVGGFEAGEFQTRSFNAEARDFLTDAFSFSNLTAGGERPIVGSYQEETKLVSGFGRANYSYKDRYFLTGVIRFDGASQFGAGNKWSTFPAVSASWRISEEDFMADGPFSELRLRGGWGLQGNPAVPPYSSLITLAASDGASAVFGEQSFTGVAPTRNPNPNLKWEETEQINVAIDWGIADNRIAGTLEGYRKNTTDLLLEVDVPQPATVSTRLENIGSVRNTGFEASLDALLTNRPNLNWSLGLVFDMNRNEVVDLGGRTFISNGGVSGQGQSGQIAQRLIPGESTGTFWGPQYIGVDDQGRQLFNQYDVTRDEDGNEISRELVGQTIQPTGDDFVIIGDANPDFSLGLNSQLSWGPFDASFLILSEVGQDVFNNTSLVYSTKSNALQDKNFLREAINDPIGILEPAIFSDRWIEDGSYIRLQNLTLGYTFQLPGFVTGRMGRIYASADNLFLITGYSGLDPAVHSASNTGRGADGLGGVARGIDYLTYPRARSFTFGVRFEF